MEPSHRTDQTRETQYTVLAVYIPTIMLFSISGGTLMTSALLVILLTLKGVLSETFHFRRHHLVTKLCLFTMFGRINRSHTCMVIQARSSRLYGIHRLQVCYARRFKCFVAYFAPLCHIGILASCSRDGSINMWDLREVPRKHVQLSMGRGCKRSHRARVSHIH